jgi:hypothetical protein
MADITDLDDLPGGVIGDDITISVTIHGVTGAKVLLTWTKCTITPKWQKYDYNPASLPEGYIPRMRGYTLKFEGLTNINALAGYEQGLPNGCYITAASVNHDALDQELLPDDLFDPKYGHLFFTLDELSYQKDPSNWSGTADHNCYVGPAAAPVTP